MAKRKRYTEDELYGPAPSPEQSLLGKAKSVGLSGLQYAGNILDTPGAMVRNAISGKNPLTPLLHPLSGEGRVQGRDMLRKQGLVGRKDTWGNFGAGLAVDIALDPLTYLTFGGSAITKAGKVAKAVGALDDASRAATKAGRASGRILPTEVVGKASGRARSTLKDVLGYGDTATLVERTQAARKAADKMGYNFDELLNQPLGGVANIGIPGMEKMTLGAGAAGADFMEGLGKTLGAIPGAKAVGSAYDAAKTVTKGLFHGPSGGRMFSYDKFGNITGLDKFGQQISELASEHLPTAKRKFVGESLEMFEQFKQVDSDYRKFVSSLDPQKAAAAAGSTPVSGELLDAAGNTLGPGGDYYSRTKIDISGMSPEQAEKLKAEMPHAEFTGQYPFSEGDLVKASDRGNMGYVQSVDADGAHVHFTEPSTKATAVVKMPFDKLSKADSTQLPESLRAMHDPVSRVLDRIIRMTAETKGDIDQAIQKFASDQALPPQLKDGIAKLADDLVQAKNQLWDENMEMGGKGRMLDETDEFGHFPRYMALRGTGPLDEFRQLPTGHPSVAGRTELLRNLRADQIEDLRMNPKYRSEDQNQVFVDILNDFGDSLGYKNKAGETVEAAQHAEELVDYVASAGKDAVEKQKRLFDNLSIKDWQRYMLAGHKRNASFRAIHQAFSQNISDVGVSLEAAFKHAGLDAKRAMPFFEQLSGLSGDALRNAKVPPELANAAAAVVKTYDNPEWAGLVAKTLDTVNRYFKPGMVLVKPAFWFRNHTSGQWANMVSGYLENPADFMSYTRAYGQAADLWRTGDPAFQRELETMGILGVDSTLDAHQHAFGGADSAQHAAYPPNALNVGETSKEVWSRMTALPTPEGAMGKVAKATSGIRHKAGTWMETNAKANRAVEYQNRASLYLYLKNKGYTPEAAAKAVQEVHYDYSTAAMAPFERDVMRRVVPFYVFSRNNMPWTVQRLIERPGGVMSQTIQALGQGKDQDELTPDYISETASLPAEGLPFIGKPNEPGAKRYVTGVGLGFEDPAGFAVPNLKQVGLEALSRTTPILKGPLEYAFGQSAFQKGPKGGRELEDLDPVLGRTLSNIGELTGLRNSKRPVTYPGSQLMEHVISNSPLSGVATSLRTLTDPRKGMPAKAVNLGTGFKLTDVSPAAQDRELMNRVSQIEKMLGGRTYTLSYIPKDKKAELTPKQQEQEKLLVELKRLLLERSKARRAEVQK